MDKSVSYSPGLSRDQTLVKQLREFQKNPRSLVFVALADSYRKQGLLRQALDILEEGLVHYPDLNGALMAKARILFDQKKYASALEQLDKILSASRDNVRAHKLRAEIFLRLGQSRPAMAALDTVLRLFPQDVEAARALEELENIGASQKIDARKISVVSSDISPSLGKVADFQVRSTHRHNKKHTEDAPAFSLSYGEEPMDGDEGVPAIATRTIAELYLRQGLKAKALLVLRHILAEDPNHTWARESLQQLETNGIVRDVPAANKKENLLSDLEKKAAVLEQMLLHFQSMRRV